ncbi:XK-related 7-like [Paramuricea clavata]|uniref:XK-related protein n=1 Tax=Paramuricea clavata TaxID=317549 RepID=A0A6S7H180_PARCT|nr:XK-related 7-like [Paramuricea clavata]
MIAAICLKFLFFIGALLSFADPLTDGLTCWKYFEAGEILWFVLCLVFIILPSIIYLIFWVFILPSNENSTSGKLASKLRCCVAAVCCPFIPCCGRLYVAFTTKEHEDHQLYIEVFNCLEVGIELAPQFILQFYAAMIQSHEVSVIQIVSLSITYLRIGWCYANINDDCTFKLCFGGLVSVSARVFAYSLFAVALGPWVVLVIVLHMILTCVIQRSHRVRAFGYVCLSWLSYTPLGTDKESDAERLKWTSRTFIQPILHVIEDIIMAVFYYFFVDSGRTYPDRLKIMLGLIGGSIFGYFVLRLSRFFKCQGEESEEQITDIEACQGLNKTEVDQSKPEADRPIQAGRDKDDTTDGRWKIGFKNWRPRRRDPPVDEETAVKEPKKTKTPGGDDTDGKKSGRLGKFTEWKFRKGKGKSEVECQEGAGGKQDNAGGEGSGFVGFRKIRNFRLGRDKKQEDN